MPIIDGVKGLLSMWHAIHVNFSFKNARRQAEFLAIFGQQRSDFIKETLKQAEVPDGHSSLPTPQELEEAFPEPPKADPPPPPTEAAVEVIEPIVLPTQPEPTPAPAPDDSSMEDWNEVFGYSTVTPQIEHSPQEHAAVPSTMKAPARWPKEHMHRPSQLSEPTRWANLTPLLEQAPCSAFARLLMTDEAFLARLEGHFSPSSSKALRGSLWPFFHGRSKHRWLPLSTWSALARGPATDSHPKSLMTTLMTSKPRQGLAFKAVARTSL